MRPLLVLLAFISPAWADDKPLVVSPTVVYETGFGVMGGAQLDHRDILGEQEHLALWAGFGGRYDQGYRLELDSGRRFSLFTLAVGTSYEAMSQERFYGIGDGAADEMQFAEDRFRADARIDIPFTPELGDALKTRFAMQYLRRELMGERPESTRFEGALVIDTRAPAEGGTLDVTGWYANLHAGASRDLGSDRYWFSYYGAELQRFFDLHQGQHVLALRVVAETIEDGTPRTVDLPQLGGTALLRGYPSGRFRDRALTLASAEYTWRFMRSVAAYTFVDAGRVWPSLEAVTLDSRIGYGLGLQFLTATTSLGRIQVAASRDGDFVLELVWQPHR